MKGKSSRGGVLCPGVSRGWVGDQKEGEAGICARNAEEAAVVKAIFDLSRGRRRKVEITVDRVLRAHEKMKNEANGSVD